jgi:hypothetical protein
MKAFFTTALASLVWITFGSVVEARPFRVDDIPNGSKFSCLNCHGDNKASYNTDFGSDARTYLIPMGAVSTQHIEWAPLCPLDSDRDGWTNGEELGDPNCVWKPGDANPKGLITNPGVYESAPPPVCGSGQLEANEACDGDLLSETNCKFVGAGEGTLACTADCKFDYSGCSEAPGTTPIPNTPGSSNADGGCAMHPGGAPASRGFGALMIVGMVFAAKRIRSRRF